MHSDLYSLEEKYQAVETTDGTVITELKIQTYDFVLNPSLEGNHPSTGSP